MKNSQITCKTALQGDFTIVTSIYKSKIHSSGICGEDIVFLFTEHIQVSSTIFYAIYFYLLKNYGGGKRHPSPLTLKFGGDLFPLCQIIN
jgi:hypothetical protein